MAFTSVQATQERSSDRRLTDGCLWSASAVISRLRERWCPYAYPTPGIMPGRPLVSQDSIALLMLVCLALSQLAGSVTFPESVRPFRNWVRYIRPRASIIPRAVWRFISVYRRAYLKKSAKKFCFIDSIEKSPNFPAVRESPESLGECVATSHTTC